MVKRGGEDNGERPTGFEHRPVMVAEVLKALADGNLSAEFY